MRYGFEGLLRSKQSCERRWSCGFGPRDEAKLEKLLRDIITSIHDGCVEHGRTSGNSYVNYVKGANIAAFIKVADAILAYGVV